MSSEVHLTRAQKWDLARLAVAAAVSSVFFSLPIVLARPQSSADANRRTASVKVAEEIAVAGVSEPVTAVVPTRGDAESEIRTDVVAVVTSTAVATITKPALAPSPAPVKASAGPIEVRARVSPAPSEPMPPATPATFGRRLGRFLAGDGKYDPKPFPTITPGM